MARTKNEGLHLLARDAEDLAVITAALQDAVLHVGDMAYLPKRRQFAAVANRFRWETASAEKGPRRGKHIYERVRTGLHFADVLAVQTRNIRRETKDAVLQLLTIEYEGTDTGGVIELVFAGGGLIRLTVDCIEASLTDISGPWNTLNKPDHGLDK